MVHRCRIAWFQGLVVSLLGATVELSAQNEVGGGRQYEVVELTFSGPSFEPTDSPSRDVEFWVRFRHESGSPSYRVHGFWDGDGNGGTRGDVFRVRFTPTRPGRWTLAEVHSNRPELHDEREGSFLTATPSALHGFWEVDRESPGNRWFRRSDGSHQYIYGNTHYSYLSETYVDGRPHGSEVALDTRGNAEYFKKLRFSPIGDLYHHPAAAPFLDDQGKPTYSGDYSHRPNPEWFRSRTDVAVTTAFLHDMIADLIMAGVDTEAARSALEPEQGGRDPEPYLRYLAARYGSYPNVWFVLINEFDIRRPRYTPEQIIAFGRTLRKYLPYPTPVSVHRASGPWPLELNTRPAWNDHVVFQRKQRDLSEAADTLRVNFARGGADKPVVNDELSYQGAGDRHSEDDTVESHLGAFLGGGYSSTGYKTGMPSQAQLRRFVEGVEVPDDRPGKLGQYFAGNFNAADHTAAPGLRFLRQQIDEHVTFWKMEPVSLQRSIFSHVSPEFRAMQWPGREYVLGTDYQYEGIVARLPVGRWEVRRFNGISQREEVLSTEARDQFVFDAPDSRAALFHFRRIGD